MTSPRSTTTAPASPRGRRGLSRFVADPQELARVWGREPLLTPAAALDDPGELFSSAAVDELLSRRGLRTPFVRMAKEGRTLPDTAYTLGGGVGAGVRDQVSEDRVLAHYADGATIVLQGLHRVWEPLVTASQELAAELGHPVQVNAYVTPPSNRGFDDHYDVHDVLVLQVEGEKRWRVRPPVHPLPLRTQPWTDHREAVRAAAQQAPWLETTLRPGDCLYLPRGWLHSATALGATSIHLTVGIHVWTLRTLADDVLAAAGRHLDDRVDLREALPLGVDPLPVSTAADALPALRAALHEALDAVTDDELAAALARRVRAAQRAEPLGPLAQHDATPDTPWRVRAHLAARWEGTTLRTRVGTLELGAQQAALVRDVLAGDVDPGALDLELTRRLVLGGILVPDPAGQ